MQTNSHKLLLLIATFIFLILNTHTYAKSNDEHTINNILETHDKENIVKFISQKRNGKITIEKNKSFHDFTGKPDITLITAKSIIQDLIILKIDINDFSIELEKYIEDESKRQQEEISNLDTISNNQNISLTNKLERQIQVTQSKYDKSDSISERRQLKKELSKLKAAYKKAKNKKTSLKVYFPDKKPKNTSHCNRIKSQLQKITAPDYRHQVLFCNDRNYRMDNPGLCDQYSYGKQYTIEEHKDEVRKLRQDLSKNNCDP
ncbi:MAG: hypothetical protein OQK69_09500 [Gammaproteobacteria bacterium]|nr:hypothetical protein [Gammaproteobacteria bacterium]